MDEIDRALLEVAPELHVPRSRFADLDWDPTTHVWRPARTER